MEGPVFPGPGTERASAALPSVRIVSTTSLETTGHLVCDGCGRIVRWRVPELTQRELAEVAISSPEGWAVRSLAVSFTGTCSSCRRGTGTVG